MDYQLYQPGQISDKERHLIIDKPRRCDWVPGSGPEVLGMGVDGEQIKGSRHWKTSLAANPHQPPHRQRCSTSPLVLPRHGALYDGLPRTWPLLPKESVTPKCLCPFMSRAHISTTRELRIISPLFVKGMLLSLPFILLYLLIVL